MPEPDERDEELHDDRHVGDVGEGVDAEERGQDRDGGDEHRHEHRGQRPEHEQQDHEGADRAEQRLEEHARPRRLTL